VAAPARGERHRLARAGRALDEAERLLQHAPHGKDLGQPRAARSFPRPLLRPPPARSPVSSILSAH
jgi:hypothetical protein